MGEKEILKRYEEQKKLIKASTPIPKNESTIQKQKRIAKAKKRSAAPH